MVTMDTNTPGKPSQSCGFVFVEKRNHCVIVPDNVLVVAEVIERRKNSWFARTTSSSVFIVKIGESKFHLHKLPMVARSGYLKRLVSQRSNTNTHLSIQLENLPGGSKTFELVVKFCYGRELHLTATNIAPLYCAANFLEMTNDFELGNLVPKAEVFLSFVILSSWKDTFRVLKSCESISSWARELNVLHRCSESIACKANMDPVEISLSNSEIQFLNVLSNNKNNSNTENLPDNWWFEDVASLRIDHFIEIVASIKKKGTDPKMLGSCIGYWTVKWLSNIMPGLEDLTHKNPILYFHRFTTESIIRILPREENSATCSFLLHLLKIGLITKIDCELTKKIERRIAFQLERARAKDLLVKNSTTLYDVDIVLKVVNTYVSLAASNPTSRIHVVGRLVDEYLMLVARDENLPTKTFQLLLEALPQNARYCDDNLYRAMDMYLQSHPRLTEEDRSNICRRMGYHKLSQEARRHAMKNNRLPVSISTQFILFKPVNMSKTMTATGSNYQRTKSQAIMRVAKSLEKKWMNSHKDIKIMRQDVEMLNVKIGKLQLCRAELHRQMKGGVI